jgi:hypothetical protein
MRYRNARPLVGALRRSDHFPSFLAAQKIAFVYNPKPVTSDFLLAHAESIHLRRVYHGPATTFVLLSPRLPHSQAGR